MAGEQVYQINVKDMYREASTGYDLVRVSTLSGPMRGIAFHEMNPSKATGTPAVPYEYVNFTCMIPTNLTMATGLTLYLLFTDDGTNASDLGKVIKLGYTIKTLTNDETTDLSVGSDVEQVANATLSATSGGIVIWSKAVLAAAMDSANAGSFIAVRIRRMADDAADTCLGNVICLGGYIKNT